MASILNNSSFLFNPAGSIIAYEEDKVFSVLPNDGTVDGAVGGNSGGGTRINQQGNIEVTPANLNTYSEKFGPGYWNNFGGTITDDSVIAPNGTLTGTTFNGSPAGTYKTFTGIIPGRVYTVSMYVKLGTATNCVIIINNSIAWNTVGGKSFTSTDGLNTTDWVRISYTFTGPANGAINWHIGYQFETGVTQQSNGTYFVWGAMLNLGSTAKPYQPTTDRLGYPRIDYRSGKGKLLQEPQRTNYITNNQTSSAWGAGVFSDSGTILDFPAVSVTANYSVGDAPHINGPSLPGNGYYTDSIFVDFSSISGSEFFVSIFAFGSVNSYVGFTYNKYTKQVTNIDPAGSVSNYSSTIEYYGNDIYRITVTALFSNSPNSGRLYLGPNQVTLRVAGPQYEAGQFATSLIPTYGSSVTRAITDVVFNSPGPTKAFATKPGVILYDFDFYNFADGGSYETFLYNNGSAGSDYFYFAKLAGTGQMYWDGNNSGGYFYAGSFVPKQGKNKVAWYFTNTNSYWYVNGSLLYTGTYFDALYFTYMQTYAVAGNNFAINTFASIPDTSISQAQVQAWTNFNSGSGGTVSYSGPYTIHTFTGSATFTPSFNGQVEVLVVAGGGSGAAGWGNGGGMGGGGAGGLLYVSSYGVSAGTGITVTIGAGGASTTGTTQAGRNGTQRGNPGSNTTFGGLTALGGGGGAGDGATTATMTGGSGGGGGYASIGTGGIGTPGQGNNGGNHSNNNGFPSNYCGGGGGGAGAVGTPGTTAGGNGGVGLPYSISGFSTYYAGGGGGGTYASSGPGGAGIGGLGGGGNGGLGTTNPGQNGTPGVAYTGGAGGAGGCPGSSPNTGGNGGAGGDGIVILRYLT
jgi:hypothetical protein